MTLYSAYCITAVYKYSKKTYHFTGNANIKHEIINWRNLFLLKLYFLLKST